MREISRRSGVSSALLSAMMHNKRNATAETLRRIVRAIDPINSDLQAQVAATYVRLRRTGWSNDEIAEIGRSLAGMASDTPKPL